MFRRAHPSFYAIPIVLIVGYALTFGSMDAWQRLSAGCIVAFVAFVGISLVLWPQDR